MASTLETVPPVAQNSWTKTSPWGKAHEPIQPCSFATVMDEQLAKDLQVRTLHGVLCITILHLLITCYRIKKSSWYLQYTLRVLQQIAVILVMICY